MNPRIIAGLRSMGFLLGLVALALLGLAGLLIVWPSAATARQGVPPIRAAQAPYTTPTITATPGCGPQPWTQRAGLPRGLSQYNQASDGTYVYVNGGWDGTSARNETYRYDLASDTWSPLAPSLYARRDARAVYYNNKIYVLGGSITNTVTSTVTIYDIGADSWSAGQPMLGPLAQMAVGVDNGTIYVAGGTNGTQDQQETWAYNIAGGTWTVLSSMIEPLREMGYGLINGRLYVAGAAFTYDALYAYDIASHNWQQLANLPSGRRSPGSTVLNGKLWLFGGIVYCCPPTNETLIYDPTSNTWHTGPPLSTARAYLSGSTVGPYVVAVGGDNGGPRTNVELTLENTGCSIGPSPTPTATLTPGCGPQPWTQRAGLPRGLSQYSTASDGTYVYVNGGWDGTSARNETYRYDRVTDTWSPLAPSPDAHRDARAVYYDNKIYVLGGYNATVTSTMRIYDIGANSWSTGQPMLGPLAQMAVGVDNGTIYVAGGTNGTQDQQETWAYNIAGNSWTTLPSMIEPLREMGYGLINGRLYVAGAAFTYNALYAYDIASHNWQQLANLPSGRRSPGSTVLNSKLWLFGGIVYCCPPTNETLIYDPASNTWRTGPPLSTARAYLSGSTVGPYVVAVGGDNGGPRTNVELATEGAACVPTPTPVPTCSIAFNDVPSTNTFYPFIHCLACRGIVSGYPCGGPGEPCPGTYFRPNNNVTRGQVSKIVSQAAGFSETIPSTQWTFQDVPPPNSPFWLWIERLSGRGIIGGYPCGGPNEPCVAPDNKPYFRPNNNVTRGQLSKITSGAAGWTETPAAQTFQDVAQGSTFWLWVERASSRGVIGGYPCGGAGEPCIAPGNRPYFRPNNNATRGQMSKIAAQAFYPNCVTPQRR